MAPLTNLAAAALALGLAGCISVPSLQTSPEDVADRISGNVIAYNQAYGRAVADQILLNALRARDRQPLYYLSMSGINDTSSRDLQRQATIGSIGLGNGNPNWGVGSIQATQTNRTAPGFSLNPIGPGTKGAALQFRPVSAATFGHYWQNDWPRDILLFVIVDSATFTQNGVRSRISNTGSSAEFAQVVATIADAAEGEVTIADCAEPDTNLATRCDAMVSVGAVSYQLKLRAVDDMIYFVGSTLRAPAQTLVRPPGVYPANVADSAQWRTIDRSATLFRVEQSSANNSPGAYAAEISYRGDRYVAGPVNSRECVISADETCAALRERGSGDVTATVLSLLTQLMIVSQSEAAQLAPQNAVVSP